MKLLHIDSSILGDNSVSRVLSSEIVDTMKAQHTDIEITHRNLGEAALGHLSGAHFAAFQGQEPNDAALKADIEAGSAALEELKASDIIVIGAPMYNFAIPSQLKAWVDRICVAGQTFQYTESGPEGLLGGKKVIIAISRGGFYGEDTPMADFEHQESYLRILFTFLGITDLTFIRAEGVAIGDEARSGALEKAKAEIKNLAA